MATGRCCCARSVPGCTPRKKNRLHLTRAPLQNCPDLLGVCPSTAWRSFRFALCTPNLSKKMRVSYSVLSSAKSIYPKTVVENKSAPGVPCSSTFHRRQGLELRLTRPVLRTDPRRGSSWRTRGATRCYTLRPLEAPPPPPHLRTTRTQPSVTGGNVCRSRAVVGHNSAPLPYFPGSVIFGSEKAGSNAPGRLRTSNSSIANSPTLVGGSGQCVLGENAAGSPVPALAAGQSLLLRVLLLKPHQVFPAAHAVAGGRSRGRVHRRCRRRRKAAVVGSDATNAAANAATS